jgi:hypothetical protein
MGANGPGGRGGAAARLSAFSRPSMQDVSALMFLKSSEFSEQKHATAPGRVDPKTLPMCCDTRSLRILVCCFFARMFMP